ncbi:hypothetical protein B0H16DRAFT_1318085 [Mycena metata]|uniref:SWIM-type domain-containing protein n=1 Tax=Mycena metata TaxID=1033252 RepID=A0AAD7IXJ3_9AGAR|nr:hypothetical protein B0H16DRAFT_1318085 [Mycena metata]
MYWFCHQRGLREVWGYMWAAWYCPAKYRLWARSSQPNFLGRWRTTMSVENFWRNLKHETLHHLLHPRLDQLIYLIITEVVPAFTAKMQIFDKDFRPGRPKPLTPFQKGFKAEWQELRARPLGTREYKIDLLRWLCWCGQQKYNAYNLCKHLVQAVDPPDPAFFREVTRRRVLPIYRHPLLKPKDGSELDLDDADGSLTDGDNVVVQATPRGIKRKRAAGEETPRRPKKSTIDRGTGDDEADPIVLSSSPIRPDDNLSEEVSTCQFSLFLQQRILELRKAADIIEGQLATPFESRVWLKSIKDHNIGGDASRMVADVRHFTQTGKLRRTTWPQDGVNIKKSAIKKSKDYTNNTMGYVAPDVLETGRVENGGGSDVEML